MNQVNGETNRAWVFICNPAAIMNPEWQRHFSSWGIPDKLAQSLWQSRHTKGILSRFLAARFRLGVHHLTDPKIKKQTLLFNDEKKFEAKLVEMGSIFFYQDIIKIIDGADIRRIKQEFGAQHFSFLRGGINRLISPPIAAFIARFAQTKPLPPFCKKQALLLGLALLLQTLPPSDDLLTRLFLKLPPLSDQPQAPAGFALLQDQLKRAGATPKPLDALWGRA